MRLTSIALGLAAGLILLLVAVPARPQEPCLASVASLDPVVGTTVTTVSRVTGSRSVDVQVKSTTDCYATFGPETLTTTGTTGWYMPGGDYRIWSFGYGPNLGPLKIACKAQGTQLHVERCK